MVGEKLGKRYKLNKVLGEGGMAVVYGATDLLLDRPVAIKMLKQEFASNSEFIKRIRREARAVARLSHPNIVSIYDMGQEDDRHYLVMENITGHNLKEYIENEGPLSAARALDIADQISSALIKAHENNIVHCDIKPHNILVTDEGKVKVTDFGIARAVNTSKTLTLTDSIEGSAHYFSPEQAQGEKVKPATDIYSLGVVIYEMLTGKVPYTGDTPISVAVQHVQSPIPDLQLGADFPEEINCLVRKAMAKNPEDRFESARELKDGIEKARNAFSRAEQIKSESSGQEEDSTAQAEDNRDKIAEEKHKGDSVRENLPRILWGRLPSSLKYMSLVVIVFVAIGSITLLAYNLFMNVPVEEVPDIVGRELSEAERELTETNLDFEIAGEISDPEISEEHVAKQEPPPGTEIRQTRPVEIYISTGPEQDNIPDLIGMEEREARLVLENAGYEKGETVYEFSDLYPQDTVIGTEPPVESEHPLSEEVDLIVSMGPAPSQVEVPGLIGVDWRDAQEILHASNLRLGGVEENTSERIPEGLIIDQSVQPGRSVSAGRSIDVIVSEGLSEEKNTEDFNRRSINFTTAGDERAEYRLIIEDEAGREVVWQKFLPPGEEVEIEVYSRGDTRYQILRDEEMIYNRVID